MERIANWLEALGMPEYAQSFIENHVDFLVLRDLTDQDLKDLGVVLGDRRKILRAIGELDVAPVDAAESPQDVAERRQVTVLFTDLVGSTALSTRLDPEDLREVVSTYHRSVAETVRRFEGFLAKYTGDGVLVYFGYPGAHEDDADRAVLAGLEVVEAVAAAQSPIPLQARVGIATGLVVVGDLIGLGEAQERGIVGETPNLAARLLGVAQPNMVVIAEGTRQLVGNLFELQDLGTRNFKGIAGPTPVWGVLRANSVESRFEALHGADVTALVGREEECALLLRRWSRAKGGEGQVVLLSGEPGVGKSRLTAALLERLVSEPHVQLRYFCSPLHTDSSFYPVIKQIERAAGLSRGDTPKAKLDKLGARLTRTSTSVRDATLLAEMLSLANDGRYPTLDLTAEQRREGTLEALIAQLAALTRFRAVLMVLEDAHWVDPTTLEMLNRIVERIATLRVLLIVTFRPEFNSPWVGEPHVTSLTINRLARRETGLVIDRVLGDKLLPANVRQDIIERSDGIPLFVEEITKAVLEDQSREATEARAAEPTPAPARRSTSAVPASLQASLMARLDRLASAREVAQIAAVIGREFSYALLSAIAGKTDAELRSALDRLTAAGLLYRQGRPPNAVYLFKHALVQDAAYGSLLREPTRALHARIAEVLESQFAEIAASQPELVARHFSEAGLTEAAARRWGAAGHRSLARSALAEAAAQLARALELIAALPNASLRREQIKLQVALINALFHVKGYAAPETKAAVDRARALIEEADAVGEPLEDPLSLFSVLFAAATANFVAFNGDALREQSKEFLALAEKQGTANLIMLGHRGFGTVLTWTGEFAEGRKHLDKANSLYNPAAHRSLSIQFGHDAGVAILCHRSIALWLLGYPDDALTDARQALADAREIAQAATLMNALCYTGFTYALSGSYPEAESVVNELVSLAEEKGALYWKTVGVMERGLVASLTGRPWDAVNMIETGMAGSRATGSKIFVPAFLSHLAMAHLELGEFNEAERHIGEAIAAVEATKERLWEAEAHRLAGEVARRQRDFERAQICFARAARVARAQQAKSWELRAAMSMARLSQELGKPDEARDLIAAAYGSFTQGFETLNLKDAKAMLEALQSPPG